VLYPDCKKKKGKWFRKWCSCCKGHEVKDEISISLVEALYTPVCWCSFTELGECPRHGARKRVKRKR